MVYKKEEIKEMLDDVQLRGKLKEALIIDDGAFAKDQPVRIRCCICTHEKNGQCGQKKVGVKVNKPRRCAQFILEAEKIKPKRVAKGTYVPFHMRNKDAFKKHIKNRSEEVEAQQSLEHKLEVLKSPDILSKFRSTAGNK